MYSVYLQIWAGQWLNDRLYNLERDDIWHYYYFIVDCLVHHVGFKSARQLFWVCVCGGGRLIKKTVHKLMKRGGYFLWGRIDWTYKHFDLKTTFQYDSSVEIPLNIFVIWQSNGECTMNGGEAWFYSGLESISRRTICNGLIYIVTRCLAAIKT